MSTLLANNIYSATMGDAPTFPNSSLLFDEPDV